MPLKFCSNISFMFTESSNMLERYGLAKCAGFKAVEGAYPSASTQAEIVAAKTKANVQQALLNMFAADGYFGYTALPGKENEFRDSLTKTIQLAKALDCPKIHITAGTVNDGPVTDLHHQTYEKNLIYAEQILSKENIIGVIEPINPYSLPNYYLNEYDRAVALIKKINSKYIKLQLDIFHLQHIRGDLTNSIKAFLPHTGHIQIAQVPGRGEPNTYGEINYKYILELLEKEGYNDWIGLEYKPTAAGLSWIQEYGYSL